MVQFISKKKKKNSLSNPLPDLYNAIEFFSICFFLFVAPLIIIDFLTKIKEAYGFPETIYWVIIPLFITSIPIFLLLDNLIIYVIPPIRKYFNKVQKDYNLPNFADANRGLVKGFLYFSPLFLVVFLGLFLSYQRYSNNIIGLSVISTTLFIGIIVIRFLKYIDYPNRGK